MPEWIRIRCVNHSQVLDKFTAVLCVVTQRSSPQSRTKRTAVITQATTCALGATMSNILRPKCRFHRKRVAAILCFDSTDEHTQQKIGAFECSPNCDEYRKYSKGLCNNNLKGGGGAGKWVKYGPKLSHTPLSLSKNINFNPPHIMIILRLTPPPPPPPLKKVSSYQGSCPIDSLRSHLESLDSEFVSSLHELGDSLSSTASTSGTKVPACMWELRNSCLFELFFFFFFLEKLNLRWLDPVLFRGYHPTLKLSGIPTFAFIVSLTHRMDNV